MGIHSKSIASESRLRRWRKAKGLDLREAADLAGISEAVLSRIERGERRLAPSKKVLLARRLGVRISDLFEPEVVRE